MLSNLDSNNLYVALGLEPNATEPTVREHIGELYREALANAEHRDLRRRQYYERLLEVLPRGYNTLLDESKRAQHDAYLAACAEGFAGSFEEYLAQQGQDGGFGLREREGLLEVRSGLQAAKTPPVPSPPVAAPLPSTIEKTSPAISSPFLLASVGTGLLALVVARGVLHLPLGTGLGAAIVVAGVMLGIFYHRQRS